VAASAAAWQAEPVASDGTPPLLIAHLTDTHVIGVGEDDERHVDNNARMERAIAGLIAEEPAVAAVVATGDLTNWGRATDFARLAELVEPLRVPFLPIPGNHDDRDLIRRTFPDVPWEHAEHASWVTEVGGVRVVGLDSTIPGAPGAAFDAPREAWLRSVLGRTHDGVTILAIHHPPFPTGIGWMDRSGFVGLDRLEEVLADHPVDRVVCGHLHRATTSTVAGVPVQVGLSTVQAVALDLAPDAGPRLVVDAAGYHLLVVAGQRIVTHTRYISPDAAPYAPEWADRY
jgi:3',5'-cyclic AMP phosphodiesterase CpdA